MVASLCGWRAIQPRATFDLLGAVFEPGKKSVANVNPFSTFAVELARDLPGGIDKTNLVTAEGIVSSALQHPAP
jgi:hypothetical protein